MVKPQHSNKRALTPTEPGTVPLVKRRRATLGLLSVARTLGIAAAMVEPAPVLFVVGVCNVVNVLAEA